MRVYSEAIQKFTALELAGDEASSINDIIGQLGFPIEQPS